MLLGLGILFRDTWVWSILFAPYGITSLGSCLGFNIRVFFGNGVAVLLASPKVITLDVDAGLVIILVGLDNEACQIFLSFS